MNQSPEKEAILESRHGNPATRPTLSQLQHEPWIQVCTLIITRVLGNKVRGQLTDGGAEGRVSPDGFQHAVGYVGDHGVVYLDRDGASSQQLFHRVSSSQVARLCEQ